MGAAVLLVIGAGLGGRWCDLAVEDVAELLIFLVRGVWTGSTKRVSSDRA